MKLKKEKKCYENTRCHIFCININIIQAIVCPRVLLIRICIYTYLYLYIYFFLLHLFFVTMITLKTYTKSRSGEEGVGRARVVSYKKKKGIAQESSEIFKRIRTASNNKPAGCIPVGLSHGYTNDRLSRREIHESISRSTERQICIGARFVPIRSTGDRLYEL